MALPSSGPISLSQIQAEFGGANPISMSEYYGAASGVPTSGTISLSDFHGKSAYTPMSLSHTGGSGSVNNASGCQNVFASATISVSGGTGPYTYSWTKISGSGSISSGGTSASMTAVNYMCPDANATGVFRCTVTDATSATATRDVTYSFAITGVN